MNTQLIDRLHSERTSAAALADVLKACRDALRESAKQHRASRMPDIAHATMCDVHAEQADKVLAQRVSL